MHVSREKTLTGILFCLWVGLMILILLGPRFLRRDIPQQVSQAEEMHRFEIRVLLFDNIRECRIASDAEFCAVVSESDKHVLAPKMHHISLRPENINLLLDGLSTDTELIIRPSIGHVLEIEGTRFRGSIQLIVDRQHHCFDVINRVDLEDYLAGVIGSEMPGYWDRHVLMAQSIAARTYCLYISRTFGRNRSWDLRRTEASQVYGGIPAETAVIRDIVKATEGLILTCQKPDSNQWDIFPAYYSSVCGGHTEDNANVFGEEYTALQAVACPFCESMAPHRFYEWKSVTYNRTDVSNRLLKRYRSLSRLEKIVDVIPSKISTYDDFQRVTEVMLIGSNGQKQSLEAENFRLAIDPTGRKIRSTAFVITKSTKQYTFEQGRGFGHSVGLCQYGALGLARQGCDFSEILQYYYPESHIDQFYSDMKTQ